MYNLSGIKLPVTFPGKPVATGYAN